MFVDSENFLLVRIYRMYNTEVIYYIYLYYKLSYYNVCFSLPFSINYFMSNEFCWRNQKYILVAYF